MSSDDDKREIAHLQRLNVELHASLQRCKDLVTNWRTHEAARKRANSADKS